MPTHRLSVVSEDGWDDRFNAEGVSNNGVATANDSPSTAIDRYEPFPINVLPDPVCGFVKCCAKSIGCDLAFVALPVLSALAAAIGNARRIELKRGWTEPSIIWTAIVGESGTQKSPAFGQALQPTRDRQSRAMAEYASQAKEYDRDRLFYERDLAAWKRGKDGGDPPREPERPVAERFITDDVTIEKLAVMLQVQPRGFLLSRDELAGWLGSFDRYAKGSGDASRWIEMWGGRSITVDRKGSGTVHVPRAAVSIAGGIQPGPLRDALGREHFENGLVARLLVTMPPRRPKRWTEADIDPRTVEAFRRVVDGLYNLTPVYTEPEHEPAPEILRLSPDGKAAWVEFYNEHAQEQAGLVGDLAAAWSKLEAYTARLALLIHSIREVVGDASLRSAQEVDAKSIRAAVSLVRWFGGEARRVYAVLRESDERREQRRLLEKVHDAGGSMSARDLMRTCRMFEKTADAEAALDELVQAGWGRWVQPKPGPGRPSAREFQLADAADVDNTPTGALENGVMSTSTLSTPAGDSESGWGEA